MPIFRVPSANKWRWCTIVVLCATTTAPSLPSFAGAGAADYPQAKKTFGQRCTACHTFGHGIKVGPDLKGINQRRSRAWLLKFVRSSQSMIKSGDPIAGRLFQDFKQQRMPDWTDLSPKQLNALLDWLGADGPEQKEPDERDARLASAADLEQARRLFNGEARLSSGGLACANCHSIRQGDDRHGGTLGPDLTDVYSKYRDRALTLHLRRPCFLRAPETMNGGTYLTPDEAFALKAYLRSASLGRGAVGRDSLTLHVPDERGAHAPTRSSR